MQGYRRLIRDEEGYELVEFALTACVFVTLFFGLIEFCLAMYAGAFVAFAAQEGTRYAMVRGSDWTSSCTSVSSYGCEATATNVQNYVLSLKHPSLNLTTSNITVTWPGTTAAGANAGCASSPYSQGCQVKVTVSYTYNLHLVLFNTSIPFSSTSIETIQN
jgi:Flp pilus assembly protein TadG